MLSTLRQRLVGVISERHFSEILTGSAYALTGTIAATALTMLANIVIARVYGAASLGVLAVINSFLMLVTIFTVLGTDTSTLRFLPEHVTLHSFTSARAIFRKVEYLVVGASVVSGTACFFLSEMVARHVFHKPYLASLLSLASVFVVFNSLLQLNTMAVRGLQLVKTFAVMRMLAPALLLLAIVLLAFWHRQPHDPVYAQLAAYAVAATVGSIIIGRAFRRGMEPGDRVEPVSLRDITDVSFPMLMTRSMYFFIAQTGVIILGSVRTESEVGYYSAAVKLSTVTTLILSAINAMAAPKFSELYHSGQMKELFRVARKCTALIFVSTVPILVFLIAVGRPAIGLLFGGDFETAYLAMVFLVTGQFVNSISGPTAYFLNMSGEQRALRNIITVAAAINILLCVVLAPRFGINGAAFASMVATSYWNLHALVYIRKTFGHSIGLDAMLQRWRARGS